MHRNRLGANRLENSYPRRIKRVNNNPLVRYNKGYHIQLEIWVHPSQGGTLRQYVDVTKKQNRTVLDCEFAEFLGLNDYQVSQQKAQVSPQ